MTLVRLTTDSAARAVAGIVGPLVGLPVLLAHYEPASTLLRGFATGSIVFFVLMGGLFLLAARHLRRTGAVGKAPQPVPTDATFEPTGALILRTAARGGPLDLGILVFALATGSAMLIGFGFGAAVAALIWAGFVARWERANGTQLFHQRSRRWGLKTSVSLVLPVDQGDRARP